MTLRLAKRLSVMVAPLAGLSGCQWKDGFLAAAGPVAALQRTHFLTVTAWMMVVVVPLFVAVPLVLWRYRRSKDRGSRARGRYDPEWEFNWILESLVWGVPVVIVAVMGVNLWRFTQSLNPYDPLPASMSTEAPLKVDVVTLDWKFLFLYPKQGIATVNRLVIPAGRPVEFKITSATVMQSFDIPRLGSQIYAMAGMVTKDSMMAARPGRYRGLNTQYNGPHFPEDHFIADAVSQGDFDSWVAQAKAAGHPLDKAALAKLTQRSVLPAPVTYSAFQPGLFGRIVGSFKHVESGAA